MSIAFTRSHPGSTSTTGCPQERATALAALLAEARRDPPNPGNAEERLPDDGNADRLERFLAGDRPTVVYFGKLMRNKGVHVLLEALRGVDARAVIVGFGDDRAELERLAGGDVLFTGPLEHRHLVHLLALADACVVPSIFPEAFGMVAAEAAAAGCPPIVARHSGLAEIAAGLAEAYPPALRHLAGFATGDADDLRAKLTELLALGPADRAAIREAARRAAVERWSWTSVAAPAPGAAYELSFGDRRLAPRGERPRRRVGRGQDGDPGVAQPVDERAVQRPRVHDADPRLGRLPPQVGQGRGDRARALQVLAVARAGRQRVERVRHRDDPHDPDVHLVRARGSSARRPSVIAAFAMGVRSSGLWTSTTDTIPAGSRIASSRASVSAANRTSSQRARVVRDRHALRARVARGAQAATARRPPVEQRERPDEVVEGRRRVRDRHARGARQLPGHHRVAGDRRRVARRCAGPGRGPPGAVEDHLAARGGDPRRRLHEPQAVQAREALDVDAEHADLRVVGEVRQEVARGEVHLVADRDHVARIERGHPRQPGDREGAAAR